MARGQVVGRINRKIVARDGCGGGSGIQPRPDGRHRDEGVYPRKRDAGGGYLVHPQPVLRMDHLTLQVGQRYGVVVDDGDAPHSRRRKVH